MSRQSSKKRVLIADDEEDVRVLLKEVLEEAGYLVDVAGDGKSALERVDRFRPDLLILDLMMPVLDGWTVIERLKTRKHPPAVVVLTGMGAFSEHRPEPRAAAILRKPFSLGSLLRICGELLPQGELALS